MYIATGDNSFRLGRLLFLHLTLANLVLELLDVDIGGGGLSGGGRPGHRLLGRDERSLALLLATQDGLELLLLVFVQAVLLALLFLEKVFAGGQQFVDLALGLRRRERRVLLLGLLLGRLLALADVLGVDGGQEAFPRLAA